MEGRMMEGRNNGRKGRTEGIQARERRQGSRGLERRYLYDREEGRKEGRKEGSI
jgi:hypothetical protein